MENDFECQDDFDTVEILFLDHMSIYV